MLSREEFERRLVCASEEARAAAGRYVHNNLPVEFRYRVFLNQSYDGHRKDDEVCYPEDDGIERTLLQREEVVETLYRDNRCPVWIDVSAVAAGKAYTCLRLLCAGRYSDNDDRLYYKDRRSRPFAVKGPDMPIWWSRREDFLEKVKWRLPKMPPESVLEGLIRSGLYKRYSEWVSRRYRWQRPRFSDFRSQRH